MNALLKTLTLSFLVAFPYLADAQKGIEDGSTFGHGEDSINCRANLSLYRDYIRQRDYETAIRFWRPAFRECPVSTKNLYIDGVKIYKYFIGKEKNAESLSAYIDSLMLVYDQRIHYYPNDKGDQRGRQGVDLLRYRRNDDIKYIQQAYGYLKESINLEKKKCSEAVIATYFTSSFTLFENQQIDENTFIDDYILSSRNLLFKLKKIPANKTLNDIRAAQDLNFQKAAVGCENLQNKLAPIFEENKQDTLNLQLITNALNLKGCTGSNLFYEASGIYYEMAPSAESAALMGSLAYEKGEYSDAVDYFKQAVSLETDTVKKAAYLLGLSKTYYKQNRKPDARQGALDAIKLRPSWGDPYILIGQLYAESSDECSSLALPKSIYWVAVDKFYRAKQVDPSCTEQADKLIVTYSQYFPNKEDAFFQNIHEGATYTVNCWINETTKVRF
ncbi:MAG: tetratricopeptide repeat protein [Bacteroidales bacterium]|nr:tetratricopeptide repeat protein [Bacteroidales bacterium]